MLSSLPTRRVVVFNMASASGEFIKSLAAKGRIVVTATRNGQETNATRFPGFFIAALNATDADTDQDGHTSVLEAFVYANRLTGDFYKRAGRLATEHAMFDDNGDGVGREKVEAGEGLLARATYLDSLSMDEAAANAATGKLMKERARLEGEIEQLIARKVSMAEAEYEANLERLFIRVGKGESIDQAGGFVKMKTLQRFSAQRRKGQRLHSFQTCESSFAPLRLCGSTSDRSLHRVDSLRPFPNGRCLRHHRTQERRLRQRPQAANCATRL